MKVFDFHCHPALKAVFSSNDFEQHAWRNFRGSIDGILASQCSLALLADEKVNLVCVGLHAPERAITNNWLVFFVAAQFRGWDMDSERIRKMGIGEIDYFFLLREDLRILLKEPARVHSPSYVKREYASRKIRLISSMKEYNPADQSTLHVIPTVEGSHCFFSFTNRLDENTVDFQRSLENFNEFLRQTGRIFSLNLTHLTRNPLCNHAYGLKLIKDDRFLPHGCGISKEGLEWINVCQGPQTVQKICIDIKHMSLGARIQYYAYRKEQNITTPIVATHIGVTGFSRKDLDKHVIHADLGKKPKISYIRTYSTSPNGELVSLYPLSINLYDEDVLEVLLSDGLIGLSLDQRILGINNTEDPIDVEYISMLELENFLEGDKARLRTDDSLLKKSLPQLMHTQRAVRVQDTGKHPVPNHPHGKYFMLNLLHVIKTAQINEDLQSHLPEFNAWDKVCIGSDFDGLIDPINLCRNVSEFANLRVYLIQNLATYASYYGVSLTGLSTEIIADKLFFQNGLAFMSKYYN